jgi:Holliday junction DNA helicase RuvB
MEVNIPMLMPASTCTTDHASTCCSTEPAHDQTDAHRHDHAPPQSTPTTPASADPIELVPDLDAPRLDAKLRGASRRTDVGHRELAFYLAEMQQRGLHQMLGFTSAVDYAARKLLMNRRTAQELLTVGRALEELDLIDDAFCTGRIRWSHVRLLVRIAVKETQAAWLEQALALSWNEFDRAVATSEKGRPPRKDGKGIPQVKIAIRGRVNRLDYETWELAKRKLEAERGEPMLDAEVMAYSALHVCPGCERRTLQTPEGPAEVANEELELAECDEKTSHAMRQEVIARDGFRCRACKGKHDLHAHHVIWRSRKGPTKPWNLITLCARCHGLVHEGLIVLTGKAPHGLKMIDRHGNSLDVPGGITGLTIRNLRAEAARAKAAAESTADASPAPSRSSPEPQEMTIERIPGRVDRAWWRLHVNLFSFPEGGEVRFKPGVPMTQAEVDAMRSVTGAVEEAADPDLAGRPRRFADVIGQPRAVHALEVAAKSARKRKQPVDHVLLLGQAGLGKTTLAEVLANEVGTRVHRGNGALIQDPGSLLRLLTGLEDRDVLFLDEIHALPKRAMEALYEAMEDGRVSLTVTNDHVTRTVQVTLARFTLVGATTEIGRLPEPFVSRFPIREHLSSYPQPDLAAIVSRAAAREGVPIEPDAAAKVAAVARGVPRAAIGLVRRVRDEALFQDRDRIDLHAVERGLEAAGIDEQGLQPVERQAFDCLRSHGGAMGITRWAALSGLAVATLRRLCEPELIRLGLISVTPRGRVARAQLRAS